MKKKKLLVIVTGLVLVLISFIPSILANETNRTVNQEDVLSNINKENFSLQVIGDYTISLEEYEFSANKTNALDKPGNTDGVIIASDKVKDIFTNSNKPEIKSALKAGSTFFVLGNEMETQDLAEFLNYDINLEEDIKSPGDFSSSDKAIYVSSNGNDKLTFGVIQNKSESSAEAFKKGIVQEAWMKRDNENRRGDIGSKKGLYEEHARDYVFTPEEVSADIYPSIGDGWKIDFGPQEYTWTTDHGHVFERKRGYYLDPSQDQDSYNDWTALTMYMEAVPDSSTDSVSEIHVTSNTDYSDTDSGIGRYGPKSDPGSNTLSYQIGVNTDDVVSFSASWSTTSSDLTVTNNSCTSCGYVDITLDYDVTSDYAQQTSTHEPAFSYTNPEGASYSDMINERTVTFRGWGYVGKDYTAYYDSTTSPRYGTNIYID